LSSPQAKKSKWYSEAVQRRLGLADYATTLEDMRAFTDARSLDTPDEIWFLEHPPVFTLGLNADPAHLLDPGDVPVVEVDRGGQVTYHGPGQLIVYALLDLRRSGTGVRELVTALEDTVIAAAARYGIVAGRRRGAPGVYVDDRKLASLGLRVRRGCSYHGLAFNIDMDLSPFGRINPCGFEGLDVTQLADLGGPSSVERVAVDVAEEFMSRLPAHR